MVPGRADVTKIKEMVDIILEDDQDKTVTIPLKDLVWTMVNYSHNIKEIEELIHAVTEDNINLTQYNHRLLVNKECNAAKENELGRLISMYSDFDTQRIYKETSKIFI